MTSPLFSSPYGDFSLILQIVSYYKIQLKLCHKCCQWVELEQHLHEDSAFHVASPMSAFPSFHTAQCSEPETEPPAQVCRKSPPLVLIIVITCAINIMTAMIFYLLISPRVSLDLYTHLDYFSRDTMRQLK